MKINGLSARPDRLQMLTKFHIHRAEGKLSLPGAIKQFPPITGRNLASQRHN